MKRFGQTIGMFAIAISLISCLTPKSGRPTPLPATATPVPISMATSAPAPATPTAGAAARATISPTSAPLASPTSQSAATAKTEVAPDAVLARVSAVRGLAAKGEVPFTTLSREQLRAYLTKSFEKENGKEEIEKTKALWVTLDLIEEKDDLYVLWLGLLSEQVAGFYELDNRSMTLVSGRGAFSTADELTLAHEYVHALQDQQFDLGGARQAGKA